MRVEVETVLREKLLTMALDCVMGGESQETDEKGEKTTEDDDYVDTEVEKAALQVPENLPTLSCLEKNTSMDLDDEWNEYVAQNDSQQMTVDKQTASEVGMAMTEHDYWQAAHSTEDPYGLFGKYKLFMCSEL